MKKPCYLVLVVLFSAQLVTAQKYFVTGYVVNGQGDTLKGYVDDRVELFNTKGIFYKDAGDKTTLYKPSQVVAVSNGNARYTSRYVQFEKNEVLRLNEQVEMVSDTLMLEVLAGGQVSLYALNGIDDRQRFFIETGDGKLLELVNRKTEVMKGGMTYINEQPLYRNLLGYALKACNNISDKLKAVRLTKSSLMNLMKSYYQCTGLSPDFTKERVNARIEWGILAGVSANRLVMKSDLPVFQHLTEANITATGIPLGLTAEIVAADKRKRLSGGIEVLYHSLSFADGDIKFDMDYLRFNLLPRYYFSNKTLRPFINAGVTYAFLLKSEGLLSERNVTVNRFSKSGFGISAGAGCRINKFSAEIRYERAAGISEISALNNYVSSGYLLLNYRF